MREQIQYYSTNHNAPMVSFREAMLKGQAPDKGLYMPTTIPKFTNEELESFRHMKYHEIAFSVISKFLHEEISENELKQICKDAYNFDVPIENVFGHHHILRLDQGPTASFKDFAARMMGRLMQYFLQKENRDMHILTATSGDTGSAIASAFYGLDNIKVTILFPINEVTDRQRKQMTTLGKNIHALAIDGKFDDCQAFVKKAFADEDFSDFNLSSANSINIGRLIPQSVYYVYAWSVLTSKSDDKVIFSVPSGNFGNLMGGLIAFNMGLPVQKFIISTNENDEVPEYLRTNVYRVISPSKNCISSAMNVGHPSNMARIIDLYGGKMNEKGDIIDQPDLDKIKNDFWGISVSDDITRNTIKEVYKKYGVLLEPHGAVGWYGTQKCLSEYESLNHLPTITLETAHPAKFPQEIKKLLSIEPELPVSLQGLDSKDENYKTIETEYNHFKQYLLDQ